MIGKRVMRRSRNWIVLLAIGSLVSCSDSVDEAVSGVSAESDASVPAGSVQTSIAPEDLESGTLLEIPPPAKVPDVPPGDLTARVCWSMAALTPEFLELYNAAVLNGDYDAVMRSSSRSVADLLSSAASALGTPSDGASTKSATIALAAHLSTVYTDLAVEVLDWPNLDKALRASAAEAALDRLSLQDYAQLEVAEKLLAENEECRMYLRA
jgi:hypothetical protein